MENFLFRCSFLSKTFFSRKPTLMNKILVISVLENLAGGSDLSSKLAGVSWTSYKSYTSLCELRYRMPGGEQYVCF